MPACKASTLNVSVVPADDDKVAEYKEFGGTRTTTRGTSSDGPAFLIAVQHCHLGKAWAVKASYNDFRLLHVSLAQEYGERLVQKLPEARGLFGHVRPDELAAQLGAYLRDLLLNLDVTQCTCLTSFLAPDLLEVQEAGTPEANRMFIAMGEVDGAIKYEVLLSSDQALACGSQRLEIVRVPDPEHKGVVYWQIRQASGLVLYAQRNPSLIPPTYDWAPAAGGKHPGPAARKPKSVAWSTLTQAVQALPEYSGVVGNEDLPPANICIFGYLEKQGHVVRNWKRRYVEVDDDGRILRYYDRRNGNEKGRISLKECSLVIHREGIDAGWDEENRAVYVFQICSQDTSVNGGQSSLYLRCESEDEMVRWVNAVNRVCLKSADAAVTFITEIDEFGNTKRQQASEYGADRNVSDRKSSFEQSSSTVRQAPSSLTLNSGSSTLSRDASRASTVDIASVPSTYAGSRHRLTGAAGVRVAGRVTAAVSVLSDLANMASTSTTDSPTGRTHHDSIAEESRAARSSPAGTPSGSARPSAAASPAVSAQATPEGTPVPSRAPSPASSEPSVPPPAPLVPPVTVAPTPGVEPTPVAAPVEPSPATPATPADAVEPEVETKQEPAKEAIRRRLTSGMWMRKKLGREAQYHNRFVRVDLGEMVFRWAKDENSKSLEHDKAASLVLFSKVQSDAPFVCATKDRQDPSWRLRRLSLVRKDDDSKLNLDLQVEDAAERDLVMEVLQEMLDAAAESAGQGPESPVLEAKSRFFKRRYARR